MLIVCKRRLSSSLVYVTMALEYIRDVGLSTRQRKCKPSEWGYRKHFVFTSCNKSYTNNIRGCARYWAAVLTAGGVCRVRKG